MQCPVPAWSRAEPGSWGAVVTSRQPLPASSLLLCWETAFSTPLLSRSSASHHECEQGTGNVLGTQSVRGREGVRHQLTPGWVSSVRGLNVTPVPDLAQSTSLGAQNTRPHALGLPATSSPRELRANPSATTTTPAPLLLLAFVCTSWLPLAPVGASVAGSRPVCVPWGSLFLSAVEQEEGCPLHLCSRVLQLLSSSMGAVPDQQSRRTEWDWFMAGPVFVWGRREASARFLPGSFLWRASAPPLLPGLEKTPHTGVPPEPKGLRCLLSGGLNSASLSYGQGSHSTGSPD